MGDVQFLAEGFDGFAIFVPLDRLDFQLGWIGSWHRTYQGNCHHVLRYEDIPLLTKQQIEEMAREDEEYHRQIDVALAFFNEIKGENHSPETKLVFQAAELMGIMPEQKEEGLYRWLIARNGLTDGKRRKVLERMKRTPGLLFLAADYLVTLFVPGLQLTFPIVGTAMTQQKGKYYYRG